MASIEQSNTLSPSTTFVWRLEKIDRPLQAHVESPRRGRHAWHRLGPFPRRRALNVRLVKLGGTSLIFQLEARGITAYVPGDVALYDVWKAITGCV
jgi:hypothetical protein